MTFGAALSGVGLITVPASQSVALGAAIEGLASVCVAVRAGCELQYIKSKMDDDLYKLEEASKKTTEVPDYIKDNRVPIDKETILRKKEYQKTNIKVKGAQVYKNGDKYYYRDTFHTGEAAHLEVFDKNGNHIGEANPQTGELIPGTADATKKINIK